MALELDQINLAQLDIYVDAAGELQARHGDTELSAHGDTVVVRTDDRSLEVRFSPPSGWHLDASHEDEDGDPVSWDQGPVGPQRVFAEATTDPLTVTLSGQAEGSTQTQSKKVHVHAKPKGALPDRG